nr:hypothetical protein [Leptospira kirschneri]
MRFNFYKIPITRPVERPKTRSVESVLLSSRSETLSYFERPKTRSVESHNLTHKYLDFNIKSVGITTNPL